MMNLAMTNIRRSLFLALATIAIVVLLISPSFAAADSDDEAETKAQEAAIKTAEDFATSQVKKFGPESREALEARTRLVDLYIDGKRQKDSLPMAEECYKLANKILPAKDGLRLRVLNDYGRALLATKRDKTALPILEEAYQGRLQLYGEKNIDTLMSLQHIGTAYTCLNRIGEGVGIYEFVCNLRKELLSPNDPSVVDLMERHAIVVSKFDVRKSVALSEEVIRIRKATLGPNHRKTHDASIALAAALLNTGKAPQAIISLKQEVETCNALFTEADKLSLKATSVLATGLMMTGKLEEAEKIAERGYRIACQKYGNASTEAAQCFGPYVLTLMAMKRFDNLEKVSQLALASIEAKLGKSDPLTIFPRTMLGTCYLVREKDAEALVFFKENYQLLRASSETKTLSTLQSMEPYGLVLTRLNQHSEAVKVQEELYAISLEALGDTNEKTIETKGSLAAAYSKVGKFDDAIRLSSETVDFYNKKYGLSHTETCKAMIALGAIYVEQGENLDKAESFLLGGYHELKMTNRIQNKNKSEGALTKAREALVKLYELQKKPDEVAKWREPLKR